MLGVGWACGRHPGKVLLEGEWEETCTWHNYLESSRVGPVLSEYHGYNSDVCEIMNLLHKCDGGPNGVCGATRGTINTQSRLWRGCECMSIRAWFPGWLHYELVGPLGGTALWETLSGWARRWTMICKPSSPLLLRSKATRTSDHISELPELSYRNLFFL